MNAAVRAAVEAALGEKVARVAPLSGGDINDAYRVELSGARAVFVKVNERADPTMFPAEARGLRLLSGAAALRVPDVLAVSSGKHGDPACLVLEYLEPARRTPEFDERLGRGLAALHRKATQGFGLDHDNFIGRLPQSNRPRATWAEFYAGSRLEPQLAMAVDAGRATSAMRRGFDRLLARIAEFTGPEEPPALLHGDLWGGNLHVDERGQPCLIDPAVYGGHREMDLAMMRLFGGFGDAVFAAYDEAFRLSPGHRERVALYQIYPLMVHVNLFGGSYSGAVERALGEYV